MRVACRFCVRVKARCGWRDSNHGSVILATLMAIPILREPVSPSLLVGGSLALAGIYVTERVTERS